MGKLVIEKVLVIGYILGIVTLTIKHGVFVGLSFLLVPLFFTLFKNRVIKEDADYQVKAKIYVAYVIVRVLTLVFVFGFISDFYVPNPDNVSTLGPLVSFDHFRNLDVSQFTLPLNVLLFLFLPFVLVEGALLIFPPFNKEIYSSNMQSIFLFLLVLVGQLIGYYVLFYIHYLMIFISIQL